MSQEYTEEKVVTLKYQGRGHRFYEALLILVALFAIYLMVSLLSFDPSDPSWSQTAWHEPINNIGGVAGAWLADTLFFVFGVLAYSIPPVTFAFCGFSYKRQVRDRYVDYFAIALRLIGMLALLLSACGLASLNVDDLYYFASGGLIGSLLSNVSIPIMGYVGSTLMLMGIWAVGLTLFTGWSWLAIAEKIGAFLLTGLTLVSRLIVGRQASSPVKRERLTTPSNGEDDKRERLYAELEDDPLLYRGHPISEDRELLSGEVSSLETQESLLTDLGYMSQNKLIEVTGLSESQNSTDNAEAKSRPPIYSIEHVNERPANSSRSRTVLPLNQQDPPLGDFSQILQPASPSADFSRFSTWSTGRDDTAISLHLEFSTEDYAEEILLTKEEIPQFSSPEILFVPVFDEVSYSPQVKQGIGPELPRPNPVRIPTRRELAAAGIKRPSQRIAEVQTTQETATDENTIQQESSELTASFALQQDSAFVSSGTSLPTSQKAGEKAFDKIWQQQQVEPDYVACHSPRPVSIEEEEASPLAEFILKSESADSFLGHYVEPETSKVGAIQNNDLERSSFGSGISPLAADTATTTTSHPVMEGLIHPFLMRSEQSREKPTTPLPTLDLLTKPPLTEQPVDMFVLEQLGRLVEARLADYRVKAEVVNILPGPVITLFELDLAPGVKVSRISNLSRDLARSLSTVAVRVVEVIPGKSYVGLELPNEYRQTVYLRDVLDCAKFRENPSPLTLVLGKDIAGQPVIADLAKMPHLLVAGTTGSGKSVGINAMILSMLFKASPDEVRFIMIDPKMLELSVYEGIPHLLTEVVTDMKDAANALRWCVGEMERRYKLMSALGVRNLTGYNERVQQAEEIGRPIPDPFWKPNDSMEISPPILEKLPYIVVMVDEFADLIMAVGKKVEELIARLAQKARAAGIHLVLATQRPSVDVITGLIKANIPTRIAFTVSSKIDSRTILDQGGAESLLGMGDMLYMPPNSSMPVRVHGAFVRDQEVHAVVQDWKARAYPQYIDGILHTQDGENGSLGENGIDELDTLFDQAVDFVVEKRRASISGVQRQFRIGYNRAARIIEQMENQGIVSAPGHNGNRDVLAPPPHE